MVNERQCHSIGEKHRCLSFHCHDQTNFLVYERQRKRIWGFFICWFFENIDLLCDLREWWCDDRSLIALVRHQHRQEKQQCRRNVGQADVKTNLFVWLIRLVKSYERSVVFTMKKKNEKKRKKEKNFFSPWTSKFNWWCHKDQLYSSSLSPQVPCQSLMFFL